MKGLVFTLTTSQEIINKTHCIHLSDKAYKRVYLIMNIDTAIWMHYLDAN